MASQELANATGTDTVRSNIHPCSRPNRLRQNVHHARRQLRPHVGGGGRYRRSYPSHLCRALSAVWCHERGPGGWRRRCRKEISRERSSVVESFVLRGKSKSWTAKRGFGLQDGVRYSLDLGYRPPCSCFRGALRCKVSLLARVGSTDATHKEVEASTALTHRRARELASGDRLRGYQSRKDNPYHVR